MNPSIALITLWGALSAAPAPKWEKDYRAARTVTARVQKPMAVFVASGKDGWKKFVTDGRLDAESKKLLSEQYVVVYVDRNTTSGRKTADSLGFTELPGLVLSDRTGDLQAFRHEGELSVADLARFLTRYADPGHVVYTTESNGGQVVTYQPITPANYYAPGFGQCQT